MKIRQRTTLREAIRTHTNTQERIALECDLHPTKLSRIVNGLTDPTQEERIRLAAYFNKKPRQLFPRG